MEIVQLAQTYKSFPADQKYVIVEPKIDGWRLAAHVKNGKITFSTRQGNTQPMTKNLHFVGEQLLALGFNKGMIDGEILVGDWNGTAVIRKDNPTPEEKKKLRDTVVFWVFDYTDDAAKLKQHERTKLIHKKIGKGKKNVHVLPHWKATNDAEVQKLFKSAIAAGHEGVVVKIPDAVYEQKRTKNWLKIKAIKTFDAKIIGSIEGKGYMKGMLGKLVAVMKDGTKIKVGTGFKLKDRMDLWKRRNSLVGRWIEVKAQDSKVAKARNPVFVRFREDIIGPGPKIKPAKPSKPAKPTAKPRKPAKPAKPEKHLTKGLTDSEILARYKSCIEKVEAKVGDEDKAYAFCTKNFRKAYGDVTMKRVINKLHKEQKLSGEFAKATPEMIRKKYRSCIEKKLAEGFDKPYGICTASMYQKYGMEKAKAALKPVFSKQSKEAQAAKKAKKRNNPTWSSMHW